jgi:hypothetical protein
MQRLCGRPGCSDSASVVYGMRPEDLVFWIDVPPEHPEDGAGVLCRRHADSMVVPRGWTLDDLRDPDLHLFRPPVSAPTSRTRTARPARERVVAEQLQLGSDIELPLAFDSCEHPLDDRAAAAGTETEPPDADPLDDVEPLDAVEPLVADAGPWSPSFDEADDLDGLLSARSPLLSRAFRTAGRADT